MVKLLVVAPKIRPSCEEILNMPIIQYKMKEIKNLDNMLNKINNRKVNLKKKIKLLNKINIRKVNLKKKIKLPKFLKDINKETDKETDKEEQIIKSDIIHTIDNNKGFLKITTHHKNVFSLDYLMKKENEKILLSTISDYSETYDESPKRVSKTKKKVTFARMVKVMIYKKNEGNNKLKKNQKISNDSNFIQETYMKFL